MNQARIFAGLCFVLLLQQGSNAQLIQTFGFGGAAGNEATFPPNGQPANGTIGSMKRGSGVTPSAAGNVFASTGFTTGTTVDTADYFSFSIKANQGFKLNLDSIVFGQRRSNTGPASYSVRSSLDGFQNDLGSGSCPTNITYNNRISLGTAFQSVASTVTIDFRFYGYGAGAATGTWRLDSVRIYGSINVTSQIFGQSLSNSSLKLFPNPGSSLIKLSKLPHNCGPLEITATNGRLLLSFSNPADESTVDVSSLPAGVYFFRLPQMGLVTRWVKTRD
jgi:hypothetical protein